MKSQTSQIKLDQEVRSFLKDVVDVDNKGNPVSIWLYAGSPWKLRVAEFSGAALTNLSDVTAFKIEIFPDNDRGGTLILEKTTAILNPSLTLSNWVNGTDQHSLFEFESGETALLTSLDSLGNEADLTDYYYVVTALRSGDNDPVTVGRGTLVAENDFVPGALPPPAPVPSGYPSAASLAAQLAGKQTASPVLSEFATVILVGALSGITLMQAIAIAQAQGGGVIRVKKGNHVLAGGNTTISVPIQIIGEMGVTVIPASNTQLIFTVAPDLSFLNFDTGSNATTAGQTLLEVSSTNGPRVSDCRFRGINGHAIQAYGTKNLKISDSTFFYCHRAVYVGSTAFTAAVTNNSPTVTVATLDYNAGALNLIHIGAVLVIDSKSYTVLSKSGQVVTLTAPFTGATSGALLVRNLPQNVRIDRCEASDMLDAGFKLQSEHGYTGQGVRGTSYGCYVTDCVVRRCGTWDANNRFYNGICYEAWHGFTDVRFTNCTAEDTGYGISCALVYNAIVSNCITQGCGFAIEFAGCTKWGGFDNQCDARVTDFLRDRFGLPINTCVGFGGGYAIDDFSSEMGQILGGSITLVRPGNDQALGAISMNVGHNVQISHVKFNLSNMNPYTGTPGAAGGTVAGISLQNGSGDVSITDCEFGPVFGFTGQPYSWLALDNTPSNPGDPGNNVSHVTFARNKLRNGCTNQGISIYLNGALGQGNYDDINVLDNITDGAGIAGGYIQYIPGSGVGTITNQKISGNLSPNGNNFTNDPAGPLGADAFQNTGAPAGTPANTIAALTTGSATRGTRVRTEQTNPGAGDWMAYAIDIGYGAWIPNAFRLEQKSSTDNFEAVLRLNGHNVRLKCDGTHVIATIDGGADKQLDN